MELAVLRARSSREEEPSPGLACRRSGTGSRTLEAVRASPTWRAARTPARWHGGHNRFRHRVENFFQHIKRQRCVGSRCKKLSLHCLALVPLSVCLDGPQIPF